MTLSALAFTLLVWGSLALVAGVFLYELLTVWRDWQKTVGESS